MVKLLSDLFLIVYNMRHVSAAAAASAPTPIPALPSASSSSARLAIPNAQASLIPIISPASSMAPNSVRLDSIRIGGFIEFHSFDISRMFRTIETLYPIFLREIQYPTTRLQLIDIASVICNMRNEEKEVPGISPDYPLPLIQILSRLNNKKCYRSKIELLTHFTASIADIEGHIFRNKACDSIAMAKKASKIFGFSLELVDEEPLLDQEPEDKLFFWELAQEYDQAGKIDKASELLTTILSCDTTLVDDIYSYAKELYIAGSKDTADKYFSSVREAFNRNINYYCANSKIRQEYTERLNEYERDYRELSTSR